MKRLIATTEYVVYCTTCKIEIDRMNNGGMAEAAAHLHMNSPETDDHKVIVGKEYTTEKGAAHV